MEEKEITKHIDNKLREFANQVNVSSKKEQSGLVQSLKVELSYIKSSVDEIRTDIKSGYIRREEFEPVKKVVYGMVGIILIAVSTALIALVLKA